MIGKMRLFAVLFCFAATAIHCVCSLSINRGSNIEYSKNCAYPHDCNQNEICISHTCLDPCTLYNCPGKTTCQTFDHKVKCVKDSPSCENNEECPNEEACISKRCQHLCTNYKCDHRFICKASEHRFSCMPAMESPTAISAPTAEVIKSSAKSVHFHRRMHDTSCRVMLLLSFVLPYIISVSVKW